MNKETLEETSFSVDLAHLATAMSSLAESVDGERSSEEQAAEERAARPKAASESEISRRTDRHNLLG